MATLSKRVKNLSESETLAMTRLSRELQAEGHDVINLSIGQPDFTTPEFIKQAAVQALDQNFTFYPPVPGFMDLREAISNKFKRDNNLDYPPDQIIVSSGAKHSITNVLLSLIDPGDEVLVPTPYWVTYRELIKFAEGKCVYVTASLENDYKVTPEQIEAAITDKTKLFIFSSPCNPTGSVYTRDELKDIAHVLARHKIFVISDEIYEHINFNGVHESIGQFDFIKDYVITVNGVSKGFAMTGWRLGYIGAPKTIVQACIKLQGQMTSGTCTISQKAALKALLTDPKQLKELKVMVSVFKERRDVVIELLNEIPGIKTNIPEGAFYVFPDVSELFGKSNGKITIHNSADLCSFFLKKEFVALVPGSAFGSPNCVRISYATSTKLLIEAIRRIKNAISELH